MAIIRKNEYIAMRRSVFIDPDLSFSAKGIYGYLQCVEECNDLDINSSEIQELLAKNLIEVNHG